MSGTLLPYQIEEIADQLEARALRGRISRVLPETARLAALGLRQVARPPRRDEIVRIVCGIKRCDMRTSCYSCLGKANEIMRLLDRD